MSLFSDKVVASAVFGRRFAGLALADVDLQTHKTWDPVLARSHRILVPIDVQAYVVPAVGGEETVPIGRRWVILSPSCPESGPPGGCALALGAAGSPPRRGRRSGGQSSGCRPCRTDGS